MTAFLFWNIHRKPLQQKVANLALGLDVDVLMLAECAVSTNAVLGVLNRKKTQYFYAPGIADKPERVLFFTKFSPKLIPPSHDEAGGRLTIRHLKLPGLIDILLAVCHLPSKLQWGEASQASMCSRWSSAIKRKETDVGHARTVLVGDLNMNPFESGVVGAVGLHAVVSREIAARGSRTVQQEDYPFFYNPMWSLLGDSTPGPPGTYYRSGSTEQEFFWHMFDQVLVRPELLDGFRNEDLMILESDGHTSLLSPGGVPDQDIASDHLPIFFRLEL